MLGGGPACAGSTGVNLGWGGAQVLSELRALTFRHYPDNTGLQKWKLKTSLFEEFSKVLVLIFL